MSGNPDSSSKVLLVNNENVDKIFECNELVVIIFYDGLNKLCECDGLASTFEEVATNISELYPDPGRVVIGKSSFYNSWTESFSTSRYVYYPFAYKSNVRFFINGKLATKTFFDDITVSSIVSYIQNLLDNCIQEISSICIPNNPIKVQQKDIIGYFKSKNSPEYQIFKKLSMALMSVCQFYAGFGEEYFTMYVDGNHNKPLIIFKMSNQPSPEFEQDIFSGNSSDYESLYNWGSQNCLNSTCEITFGNAVEVQKDRLISLILFYNHDDLKPVKLFKNIIKTDLKEYCNVYNFLTANGAQFSKKLQEIEKSQTDLPFLLLVRHGIIYQFPKNYDITTHQQLKKLIMEFDSNYKRNEDKSSVIHPIYRFNLFCEFSNKPVKINRTYMPNSADNFCISLFDE